MSTYEMYLIRYTGNNTHTHRETDDSPDMPETSGELIDTAGENMTPPDRPFMITVITRSNSRCCIVFAPPKIDLSAVVARWPKFLLPTSQSILAQTCNTDLTVPRPGSHEGAPVLTSSWRANSATRPLCCDAPVNIRPQ
jgi:hypothetical protein